MCLMWSIIIIILFRTYYYTALVDIFWRFNAMTSSARLVFFLFSVFINFRRLPLKFCAQWAFFLLLFLPSFAWEKIENGKDKLRMPEGKCHSRYFPLNRCYLFVDLSARNNCCWLLTNKYFQFLLSFSFSLSLSLSLSPHLSLILSLTACLSIILNSVLFDRQYYC